MNKNQIRKDALSKRNNLSADELREKSQQIMSYLESLIVHHEAADLCFYYSHKSEVRTIEKIEQWSQLDSKRIYLPKLTNDSSFELGLYRIDVKMAQNRYGIPEPVQIIDQSQADLDLIIIPGVAFDLKGRRIGMGKGYYDRFLSKHKGIFKIGLAFEVQIFDELPEEPYDERVDVIITEKGIFPCHPD